MTALAFLFGCKDVLRMRVATCVEGFSIEKTVITTVRNNANRAMN